MSSGAAGHSGRCCTASRSEGGEKGRGRDRGEGERSQDCNYTQRLWFNGWQLPNSFLTVSYRLLEMISPVLLRRTHPE